MNPRGVPNGVSIPTAQHGPRFPMENGPSAPKVKPWDGSQNQKRVCSGAFPHGERRRGDAGRRGWWPEPPPPTPWPEENFQCYQ